MSEERMRGILQLLDLSKREADVYVFLSKYGPQTVHSVSARLKIERVQTYRILKSMQEKGIVEATLEAPTRFSAVSLGSLLDVLIETHKSEARMLETEKNELVDYWKSLGRGIVDYPLAKFRVLVEQRKINEEVTRMIEETKEEGIMLTSSSGVVHDDIIGTLDSMIDHAKKTPDIQLKILTFISKDNQNIISKATKALGSKKQNMQWRHIDLGAKAFPQFVIKDGEETLLHVSREEKLSSIGPSDTGLWIRSRMFTTALKEAFMEMWRNATPAENRIEQLKTGKPIEESYVIREPIEAQTKLEQILDSAGKNIMVIMPSNGLRLLLETKLFQEHSKKNLEFQIMAPIDLDNLAAAQKLSETFQIRSVPISYLTMLTVDNKHAFIFRTSPLEGEIHVPFHWENVFYTNDNRYVERVSEMLGDMWKRGMTLDDIVSSPKEHEKSINVSSVDTVATVIDTMLKNNINLVVVADGEKPMGIVSQRDILEKIVKGGRNPAKTLSKEIMSFAVVAVDAEEPITEALATMKKKGQDKIVLFKEGKFAGVLSGGQTSKTKTQS